MQRFCRTFDSFALSLVVLLIPSALFAATFTRTLTIGDSGEDVRELQKLLNQNVQTRVAVTGDGSLGNETTYFGALTADAVSRYQELYASEILTPLGLTTGTGLAGTKTLTRINGGITPTFSSGVQTSASAKMFSNVADTKFSGGASLSSSGASSVVSDVKISSVSPTHGPAGTRVTLTGSGFTASNNTLFAGARQEEVSSSNNGTTITFTVEEPFPNNLEVPDFLREQYKSLTYGFVVQNENGKSNQVVFTLDLVN